jgi:pyruvate kinase
MVIDHQRVGHVQMVELLHELRSLLANVESGARELYEQWRPRLERRAFISGAWNFSAYLALRRPDMRALQTALMPLGLSSLGRCEGRVRPNIAAVIEALAARCGEDANRPITSARAFIRGERLLRAETARIFGAQRSNRGVRIMVTLPSEAANDGELICALVRAGMDAARINTAHDDIHAWRAMAGHVRAAEKQLDRHCVVYADLAGPKVRTLKVHVRHDARVREGDRIVLVRSLADAKRDEPAMTCTIPEILDQLRVGDPMWIDDGKIGCGAARRSTAC